MSLYYFYNLNDTIKTITGNSVDLLLEDLPDVNSKITSNALHVNSVDTYSENLHIINDKSLNGIDSILISGSVKNNRVISDIDTNVLNIETSSLSIDASRELPSAILYTQMGHLFTIYETEITGNDLTSNINDVFIEIILNTNSNIIQTDINTELTYSILELDIRNVNAQFVQIINVNSKF